MKLNGYKKTGEIYGNGRYIEFCNISNPFKYRFYDKKKKDFISTKTMFERSI